MFASILSAPMWLMLLRHVSASSLSNYAAAAAYHSGIEAHSRLKKSEKNRLKKPGKNRSLGNVDDIETVTDEAIAEAGQAGQGDELEARPTQAAAKVPGKVPIMVPEVVRDALHKVDEKRALGELTRQRTRELAHMKEQWEELRRKVRAESSVVGESATLEEQARELEDMGTSIAKMEREESEGHDTAAAHGELNTELARIRGSVDAIEDKLQFHSRHPDDSNPRGKFSYTVPSRSVSDRYVLPTVDASASQDSTASAVVQEKGVDIDTEMPYGELEPFGREDTAQELTEASVRESDEMVDQLERAEVAEEKRAVFRALTRLRGAAITSFDGVARSQTGNIDGYSKVHRWRGSHPLHHLADEESDISKWAFPNNADF